MAYTEGIHTMPAAEYHADPALQPSLSNSLMKTLLQKTPRHAWMDHPRLNPAYKPRADKKTFDLGTAAHSLLLEGVQKAARIDAKDWRTDVAKAQREEARAAGKIPILPSQYEATHAMVEAARSYIDTTHLRGIFERGQPEQVLLWKSMNVWCRARLDWLTDDRRDILDYKTTEVDSPAAFMRNNVAAHGYDTQSVWYPNGVQHITGERPRFTLLVQEVRPPFACYLVEIAETMTAVASSKVTRALTLWRDCLASNRWPGYPGHPYQAEAPVWAIREEEEAS